MLNDPAEVPATLWKRAACWDTGSPGIGLCETMSAGYPRSGGSASLGALKGRSCRLHLVEALPRGRLRSGGM